MRKQYFSLEDRWGFHSGSGDNSSGGDVDTTANDTNIGDDEGGYGAGAGAGAGAGEGEGEGEDDDGQFSDQPRQISSVRRMNQTAESYPAVPISFGNARDQQRQRQRSVSSTPTGTLGGRGRSNSGKSSSRALNNSSLINQVMKPKKLKAGRPKANTFPLNLNPDPNGPSVIQREHARLQEEQNSCSNPPLTDINQEEFQNFGHTLDMATTGMEDMSLNSTSHHDYPSGWGTGTSEHLFPGAYNVPSIQVQSDHHQTHFPPQDTHTGLQTDENPQSTMPSGYYHNIFIQRYHWNQDTQTMTTVEGTKYPWVVGCDREDVENLLKSSGYEAHHTTNTTR